MVYEYCTIVGTVAEVIAYYEWILNNRKPAPYLIANNCYHFLIIEPIPTKLERNLVNPVNIATVVYQSQGFTSSHLEFRKTVAVSLLLDLSQPNLVGL